MFLVIQKDRQLMKTHEILCLESSCKTMAGLVLYKSESLDIQKAVLIFVIIIEQEYRTPFSEALHSNIRVHPMGSFFFQKHVGYIQSAKPRIRDYIATIYVAETRPGCSFRCFKVFFWQQEPCWI